MLRNESRRIEALMATWPRDLFPVAYLASGFVDDGRDDVGHGRILRDLKRRGDLIIHEFTAAEGVDVAGDLLSEETWRALAATGFRTALCTNVMEHLADRDAFVALATRFVPEDGALVLTVPNRYPYHPDPIDTMFRPTPAALAAAFPRWRSELEVRTTELPAVCRLIRSPTQLMRKFRTASEARRPPQGESRPGGPGRLRDLADSVLPARVSVVVLRRT